MADADLKQKAATAAKEFMERCDTNNDGVVTFQEVRDKFGAKWDQAKVSDEEKRFATMDKNGDGKVDKAEFETWVFAQMQQ